MCQSQCEISAVLMERYGRTRDVPYGCHRCHGSHGSHGRRGAGRGTRRVTSPITGLTTPITVVTVPVTAVTAQITAVTAPVTAVTAQNTEDTVPAWRAVVGTPDRGRLQVPHSRSRASEAAKRQAWRVVGGAGRYLQPQRRQPQGGAPFTRGGTKR